jgi:hypothetical protein
MRARVDSGGVLGRRAHALGHGFARFAAALAVIASATLPAAAARADGVVDTTTTLFRESGGPLEMTVITPSVSIAGDLADEVRLRANYAADIVSGASVAVVDAPATTVDAITSATKLDDVRHTVGGAVDVGSDYARIGASYNYGFESDYRSHGIGLFGRAEMFERNTTVEVSYGRGFDEVCNLNQPRAQEAVERQRLPSSDGCFTAKDRESKSLSIQTFQGTWTQAWSPILTTQVTVTAQLLDGFQGNPYRAVWLGNAAAQEHHPRQRNRYAAGIGSRLWIEPVSGAVQLFARGYRDTWDVESLTAELAYDQNLFSGLSFRPRARFYAQTGAAFFSDDYAFEPLGQYFTGDRELSPMNSWTFGGRIRWGVPSGDDGTVLGFLDSFDLVLKADAVFYNFTEFRYGAAKVPNNSAFIGTFGLNAGF